jgi:hypothetical protein
LALLLYRKQRFFFNHIHNLFETSEFTKINSM